MLGCVPLFTKERFSFPVFHEEIDWAALSLHVPPAELPRLPQLVDLEAHLAQLQLDIEAILPDPNTQGFVANIRNAMPIGLHAMRAHDSAAITTGQEMRFQAAR
mgnify:CR=1 FL=1